jgi:uncharacterized membrane protein (UPF0127 family)
MSKRVFVGIGAVAVAVALGWAFTRSGAPPVVSADAAPQSSAAPGGAPTPEPPAVIPLKLPSGKVLQTEVMVRDEDRARGLMFRDVLPLDRGMLFVFEERGFHGIWMKNCRFPIDILWLDENHRVVHVEESVPPCKADPCPVYEPPNPGRQSAYVVEINARQARREKAAVGSTLEFTLPASALSATR